jgi:hypothetical protein
LKFIWKHLPSQVVCSFRKYQFNSDLRCLKGTGQLKKVATEDGHSVAEKPVIWTTTRCAKALDLPRSAAIQYRHGISLVIGNGEKATLGGHVLFHDSSTSSSGVGRVREILMSASCRDVQHVAVQKFTFRPALHTLLHLPTLELTDHEVVISPQVRNVSSN